MGNQLDHRQHDPMKQEPPAAGDDPLPDRKGKTPRLPSHPSRSTEDNLALVPQQPQAHTASLNLQPLSCNDLRGHRQGRPPGQAGMEAGDFQ